MKRYAALLLGVFLCVSVMQLVWRNAYKWVWYDELFTWNLAQQHSFRAYWFGLAAEAQPPLNSALVWFSMHVFGSSTLAFRLPSLVAFMAATVLLYRIVSLRLGKLPGLLAAVFFNINPLISLYAIEGRPYALLLFFTMATFASWQLATDPAKPRFWARWLIPVCLAGAILSHHYGILNAGIPLLFGEVARSIRRRHVDWKLVAIMSSSLVLLFLTVPIARRTQQAWLQYSIYPHAIPQSFRGAGYSAIMGLPQRFLAGLLLLVAAVLLLRTCRRAGWVQRLASLSRWPVHEAVGLAGSALTLGIVYTVCAVSTGYFGGYRYGIGACMGVIALIVSVFALLDGTALAVLLLIVAWPMVRTVPRHLPHKQLEPPEIACIRALPALPTVIIQGLAFPPVWHYTDEATRARLYFLTDPDFAKQQIYNTPEIAMIVQQPIYPMRLVDYHVFLQTHRSFLAVASGLPLQDYGLDHLKQDGYTLTPLTVPACSTLQVYRVDHS